MTGPCRCCRPWVPVSRTHLTPRRRRALGAQSFLQEQRCHVHAPALAAHVRGAKEGFYRETQMQESMSTGLERTRRCTGESARPQQWCSDRGLVQKAPDETFRPHRGVLGCATHLDPKFGGDDGTGASKTPGVAAGRGRRAVTGSGLPSPPRPGRLRACCGCCRFAGLPPSQAAMLYVMAGRFTFYHLIK